ncbi:MAG: hypothetical protein ACFE92_16035 [Promethearchaeota archaeon]
MIFQLIEALMVTLIVLIVVAVLIFLIGVFVTKWYAGRKGWDETFKTALIVNLVWFVLGIIISLIFSFAMPGLQSWIIDIIELIINIIIGAIVVMKIYNKEFGESLLFVIVIQIILFIIAIILGFILGFIIAMIILGSFTLGF